MVRLIDHPLTHMLNQSNTCIDTDDVGTVSVRARGPGVTVLVISWMLTLYTLWQMVEMHEMIPGKRLDRYHELGQEAFGEKLGLWIVVPQQLIVEVGVDIVYMVTGGKSLMKFYNIVCKGQCVMKERISAWIAIFASVHFVLSQLPNFNSIAGVSLAAAIMSLRSARPYSPSPSQKLGFWCPFCDISTTSIST